MDNSFPSLKQFFLEVAGFMAVIPPSSGISCYVKDCTYYPDRDPFCRDSGLVACLDKDDDRCGTLSFILMSSNIETRIWNCSRSTHDDCNEEATCDYMKELAAGMDDTVDACTLTCCEGDGCNDPGKMEEDVFISVHASCLLVHASLSTV